jgi:hypothetical protein
MEGSDVPSRRRLFQDALLIGGVAVVLAVVHLVLPPATRARLAFDHGTLDPVTVFTSAFVHVDGRHLLGNVAGYLAAAALAYGLAVQVGRRQWFRVTFGCFLLGLPVAVGLTSYAILAWQFPGIDPITRGFSGVGAGFVGFVFVAMLAGIRDAFGARTALFVGLAVWLLLLLEVYVIYAGSLTLTVGVVTAIGWGFCLWGLLGEVDLADSQWARYWPALGQVTTVVVFLVLFVAILFPARIVADGTVTNVFAHATGLLYGTAGATVTYRILPSNSEGSNGKPPFLQ